MVTSQAIDIQKPQPSRFWTNSSSGADLIGQGRHRHAEEEVVGVDVRRIGVMGDEAHSLILGSSHE